MTVLTHPIMADTLSFTSNKKTARQLLWGTTSVFCGPGVVS